MKRFTLPLVFLLAAVFASTLVGPLALAQQPYSPLTQEARMKSPPMQQYPPPAPKTEGSLFSDNYRVDLFTDNRASRVGDIVTINIVENSKASKQAQTNLGRDSQLSAGVDALLGYESHLGLPNEFNPTTALNTNFAGTYKGSGKTTRNESMTAQISARIIQVLPNGNMVIRGSREIKVNFEKQLIVVQGVIRPQDISPQNTILSSYVADAKIDYVGKGDVTRQQRKGWGARLIDIIWPF